MSPGNHVRIVFPPMCQDQEPDRERPPARLRTFRYGSDQPHLVLPDDSVVAAPRDEHDDDPD